MQKHGGSSVCHWAKSGCIISTLFLPTVMPKDVPCLLSRSAPDRSSFHPTVCQSAANNDRRGLQIGSMMNNRKEYATWFKELEAELSKVNITYLPTDFYSLIRFYFDNGYSAGFTCSVIKLHMSILEQQTTR